MAPPVDVSPLTEAVQAKERALLQLIEGLGRVVVAYSGGVDSAYLAAVAQQALGDAACAVTARSASMMRSELEAAEALARQLGLRHHVVDTDELSRPDYRKNDTGRCYHCKDELFDATAVVAEAERDAVVVDGFNADDIGDHRPGHIAAAEHGVRHPLAEVHLAKAEIRALSRARQLPTWEKPQLACLSSRLPYGMAVTADRLGRVEAVEMALRGQGFFDLRARLVRENDDMVRIEVGTDELPRLVLPETRASIVAAARGAGFRFVTVDLEGFRTGRMNEGLVQLGRRSAPSSGVEDAG